MFSSPRYDTRLFYDVDDVIVLRAEYNIMYFESFESFFSPEGISLLDRRVLRGLSGSDGEPLSAGPMIWGRTFDCCV